jgi:ERK and JNK pathways, inhibitor
MIATFLITLSFAISATSEVNPKIYSSLLMRKREEQKALFGHLMKLEKYEKKFKMLQVAYTNILELLATKRPEVESLAAFPSNATELEAMSQVIENTCFLGDLVLHLPDMSYRVLAKHKNWRETANWALGFTRRFEDLLDKDTARMLDLLNQEINEDQRTEDFVNPYYEKKEAKATTKKKLKPKTKKGPRMEL